MFVMNKNVSHNRKEYAKNHIVEKSDEGFAELKKAGHVDEVAASHKADGHVDGKDAFKAYAGKAAEADAPSEEAPAAEAESEEQSEESGKPARRRR